MKKENEMVDIWSNIPLISIHLYEIIQLAPISIINYHAPSLDFTQFCANNFEFLHKQLNDEKRRETPIENAQSVKSIGLFSSFFWQGR